MRKNPTRFFPQTGKIFQQNILIIIISLFYAFMGRISLGVEDKQLNYILKNKYVLLYIHKKEFSYIFYIIFWKTVICET